MKAGCSADVLAQKKVASTVASTAVMTVELMAIRMAGKLVDRSAASTVARLVVLKVLHLVALMAVK